MGNIFNYRIVIITDDDEKNTSLKSEKNENEYQLIVDGENFKQDNVKILKYTKTYKMHQDCLEDYTQKKHYNYSNREYITSQKNIIILILDETTLAVLLPAELTQNQLYKLDYVENWMKNAKAIRVGKYNELGTLIDEQDLIEGESLSTPQERFSNEIIQSYYIPKRKVK